jgi:hypothetical protein
LDGEYHLLLMELIFRNWMTVAAVEVVVVVEMDHWLEVILDEI